MAFITIYQFSWKNYHMIHWQSKNAKNFLKYQSYSKVYPQYFFLQDIDAFKSQNVVFLVLSKSDLPSVIINITTRWKLKQNN